MITTSKWQGLEYESGILKEFKKSCPLIIPISLFFSLLVKVDFSSVSIYTWLSVRWLPNIILIIMTLLAFSNFDFISVLVNILGWLCYKISVPRYAYSKYKTLELRAMFIYGAVNLDLFCSLVSHNIVLCVHI